MEGCAMFWPSCFSQVMVLEISFYFPNIHFGSRLFDTAWSSLCLSPAFCSPIWRTVFTKKIWQPLFAFYFWATGVGAISLTILAPRPLGISLYVGLVYCLVFGYAFIRLRFLHASLTGLILSLIYISNVLWIHPIEASWLWIQLPFVLGINLLGMFVAYSLEYSVRKNFYLQQVLKRQRDQLDAANLNLESRVKDLKKANKRIIELTRTDHLTQLANRRYFNERINLMVSLAKRKSLPLALIMTDIDHFKKVNDTFGHDAGDRVLQSYARLLKDNTRTEDLPARFGGEEFIILLPMTDVELAFVLAERIRNALSKSNWLENEHRITASFGVSGLLHDEDLKSFIKSADTALYCAKESGRNKTVIANQNQR